MLLPGRPVPSGRSPRLPAPRGGPSAFSLVKGPLPGTGSPGSFPPPRYSPSPEPLSGGSFLRRELQPDGPRPSRRPGRGRGGKVLCSFRRDRLSVPARPPPPGRSRAPGPCRSGERRLPGSAPPPPGGGYPHGNAPALGGRSSALLPGRPVPSERSPRLPVPRERRTASPPARGTLPGTGSPGSFSPPRRSPSPEPLPGKSLPRRREPPDPPPFLPSGRGRGGMILFRFRRDRLSIPAGHPSQHRRRISSRRAGVRGRRRRSSPCRKLRRGQASRRAPAVAGPGKTPAPEAQGRSPPPPPGRPAPETAGRPSPAPWAGLREAQPRQGPLPLRRSVRVRFSGRWSRSQLSPVPGQPPTKPAQALAPLPGGRIPRACRTARPLPQPPEGLPDPRTLPVPERRRSPRALLSAIPQEGWLRAVPGTAQRSPPSDPGAPVPGKAPPPDRALREGRSGTPVLRAGPGTGPSP